MKRNDKKMRTLYKTSILGLALLQNAAWASADLPEIIIEQNFHLGSGDTLAEALQEKTPLKGSTLYGAMHALNKEYRLSKLKSGQEFKVSYSLPEDTPIIRNISFETPDHHNVSVNMTDDGVKIAKEKIELFESKSVAIGKIESSLYQSAVDAGLPDALIPAFVNLFSWDVDFTREIRKGDTFKITYMQKVDGDGKIRDNGPILAAAMTARGKPLDAFRFHTGKKYDYFNSKGEGLRKSLLRTPLDVVRVTSHYNLKRKHPVLGYTRAHRGTDFGGPVGTPIKASGDGVVERANWYGSFGNYVRINHGNGYKTAYAHLKGFARGIRAGKRVKQGQTIAYLGNTGRSTGPHLHYEVHKNGKQVNPLKVVLPKSKLPRKKMASFKSTVSEMVALWDKEEKKTIQLASQ